MIMACMSRISHWRKTVAGALLVISIVTLILATPGRMAALFLLPGDVNQDGQVDIRDFLDLIQAFGKSPDQWLNPDSDETGDGQVDIRDFLVLIQNFGRSGLSREQGYAVGFFRDGQSPIPNPPVCPSEAQITEDLTNIVNGHLADVIRLYGQSCNLDKVPGIIQAHNWPLFVYAAAFCDPSNPSAEIASLIDNANRYPGVVKAVIVCNEPLRIGITEDTLVALMNQVRQNVAVPVTTGELWFNWRDHPRVVAAARFMLVHIHPYWDNHSSADGAAYVLQRVQALRTSYPGKRIVIGETGWPTAGSPACGGCETPSVSGQQQFVSSLLASASANKLAFFFFELFDESWKPDAPPVPNPAPVGPHWGTLTSSGACKHGIASVWPPSPNPPTCAPRVAAGAPGPRP